MYSQHVVDASAAILWSRRATIFIFGSKISAYSFCRCINHKSTLHLTFAYPRAYSSWKIARNHTHLLFVIFSWFDRLSMSHRVPIFISIQNLDLYSRENIERNFTFVHCNKSGIFLKRIKGNAKTQKEEPVSSLWNRWKMHLKKARIFSVSWSAKNCRSFLKLLGRVCIAWFFAKFVFFYTTLKCN